MLSLLLKFVGSRAGGIGALVLSALLLVGLGVQTVRLAFARSALTSARADAAALRSENDIVLAANEGQHKTIDAQAAALSKWRAQADEATAKYTEAAKHAADYAARLAKAKTELDRLKGADYESPECVNVLEIDLARVCPGHAASVRARARGLQGSAGGDSRTSPDPR